MARTRRYDSADTRKRVLDAASSAFQERGYHATSMSDVMAAADVPAGSLYHQFASKIDLALAVIRERVAPEVDATWISPLKGDGDPVPAILAVFHETAAAIERRRGKTTGCPITNLAVELALSDKRLRTALDDVFSMWGHAVRERLGSTDASGAISTIIVASFSGAMTLAKTTGSAQPLRDCAAVIRMLIGNQPMAS